jgi:hypothetical protein
LTGDGGIRELGIEGFQLVEEVGLEGGNLEEVEDAAEEEDEELGFSREGEPCYWLWFWLG